MSARLLTLVLVALAALVPQGAEAHATIRSSQSDRGGLVISLSAPVERAFAHITRGSVRVDASDPYVVRISAQGRGTMTLLSRDGHVVRAEVADGALTPLPARDSTITILGRAMMLAALVVMAGVIGVLLVVIAPGMRAPLVSMQPGSSAPSVRREVLPAVVPNSLRRAWILLAAVGLLGVGGIAVGTLRRLGSWDIITLLASSRIGHMLGIVAVELLVSGAAVAMARGAVGRRRVMGSGAIVAFGLLAIGLSGHATSGSDALIGAMAHTSHLAATSLWIGGLAALGIALALIDRAEVGALAAIVVRFSTLAVACVAVLVVTGTYRALAELGGFGDLTSTGYGQVLLVKLGLFMLLLVSGAINRFVVHPRIERAAIGLDADDRGAAGRLRRSIRVELAIGLAVLATVAVMVALPPP